MDVIDNFNSSFTKFLDARQKWADLDTLKANTDTLMPNGFRVYCVAEGKWYQLSTTDEKDPTKYSWAVAESGESQWIGTQAEWDALTDDEKAEYDGQLIGITDDYESSTFPLYDNLESFIDTTQNNVYVFGAFNNGEDYGAPLTGMSFGKVQVQIASNSVIRCIQTLDYSTNSERALTYIRTGIYTDGAWVWGKWCTGNNVYSETEETIVGTWIDGKPIYRKVIFIESLPDGSEITESNPTMVQAYAHEIENIDNMIDYHFTVFSTDLNVSFSTPTSNMNVILSYMDKTNIAVEVSRDRSAYSGYGIAEYTKTTDE